MTSVNLWLRRRAVAVLVALATVTSGACGISTQQEVEMGAQYANEINRQLPILGDAAVNRYINELGRGIARNGNRQLSYTFYVVNASQINAFAVPGGYVYVNRGLIERTRNMPELAGVLAHEIAHVEERHGVEQMEKVQGANLGLTLAYVLLGRQPSGAEQAAIGLGGNLVFAQHSRDAENDADARAVPLLVASGISPAGLTSFFHVLLSDQRQRPSTVQQWFSTHPLTEDRIRQTEALVNRVPAAQLRGLRTTDSGYNTMKSRLARLPKPRT
ncbi:MAG TPA: M48 family metallopeptidase [Longimicrobiales bacterium]|nr:M48 family metallopeptidase [Longimicrobiales bacterium]